MLSVRCWCLDSFLTFYSLTQKSDTEVQSCQLQVHVWLYPDTLSLQVWSYPDTTLMCKYGLIQTQSQVSKHL